MSARTRKPSDVARERGIVLDAETAAVVPDGARIWHPLAESSYLVGCLSLVPLPGDALTGDILTHIGGRPVAELVAAHDEAKEHVEWLRRNVGWLPYGMQRTHANAAVDFLDRCADLLIDPALVAAAHAQWADTEERGR